MTTDFTATYSPEDNKLRLYAAHRLDEETFARIKGAGFKWAPKQELFVAPKWSPKREDLLTELAGGIEPESITLAERAAMKATRLEDIAHNKAAKASAYSRAAFAILDHIPAGQPILVGHHSEAKHRRAVDKAARAQDKAAENFRAIDYYLYKAESVERHANYKNSDRTRANRIKTLLSELRDLQRKRNHAALCVNLWEAVTTPEKITEWVNRGQIRTGPLTDHKSYWDLSKGEATPEEIRERNLKRARATLESSYLRRWIEHTLNRLAYERALLGDIAAHEGELTPVILQTFARTHGADKPKATKGDGDSFILESPLPLPAHIAGRDDALTMELDSEEWRNLMQSAGYEVPAKKPRRVHPGRAPKVSLINPTTEEAAKLQELWNQDAESRAHGIGGCVITEMNQATYSRNSGGSYSPCETIEIDARGRQVRTVWRNMAQVRTGEAVARIRVGRSTVQSQYYGARSVLVITDKPQRALPVDWEAAAKPFSDIQDDKAA